MIIFYDKRNGNIFGSINGRVHSEQELNMSMGLNDIPKENIGKYIVPFEAKYREVKQPVEELVIKGNKVVKEITGEKTVRVGDGMVPVTSNNDLIYDFENGTKKMTNYKIKLDKNGELLDFETKEKDKKIDTLLSLE
jgi:hypothetical protein